MRIALVYPPPWKIAAPGEPVPAVDGPPDGFAPGDLDSDFYQTPYGLLSLGAQAIAAGHQVKVLNLSAFAWSRVEHILGELDADVWGMSCWTANRRGVALAADCIRRYHPRAPIVVGGPHATPLAREMLAHHGAIDVVCEGESELSFAEIVARAGAAQSLCGITGTVYRDGSQVKAAPPRAAIRDLDALRCPHRDFTTHIVMTSRGCPWACTFCGAETSWGRGFRAHGIEYVLDMLGYALERVPVRMLQIKDDTFTTNKKRVIELCRGIRARQLNFLWSCDTRVDVLDEELLREMRLAGCQRLSLGVESGSQRILDAIDKKITTDEIIASTEMAKRAGIKVRYYMMLGNRGETAQTFNETLEFLSAARPHEYLFSCLSIFPGTPDFREAEKTWLDREVYFSGDFQELKVPFDASDDDTALFNDWFSKNKGLRTFHQDGVDECRAILGRLGDHAPAHLDLAGAYYRDRRYDDAERHARRALELGHPTPGLVQNTLGCIAFRRGNIQGMQDAFMLGAKIDPQHPALIANVEAARAWFREKGPERGLPLDLAVRHDFQLLERTLQPALPGPVSDDVLRWDVPAFSEPPRDMPATGATMLEGHETVGFSRKRLPVV